MARPVKPIELGEVQRQALLKIVNSPTSPQRMVRRARIVLCRAQGMSQAETAREVGVGQCVVSKWDVRFRRRGLEGLEEARRPGRKPSLPDGVRESIVTEATRPPAPRKRWSLRSMARAKGVSPSTVHRLWRANDIKPHLTRTFKVSNDPDFETKFWDVMGLYLNPPEKALVLCCDEKSQCQAPERTQPGLPPGVGGIRTGTHDYKRHGTVTLFAALEYLEGRIHRQFHQKHTHKEWLGFLKHLDRQCPEGPTLHLVVDNYSTHKHAKVKSWIKWRNQRHRKKHGVERIVQHFTPTSSSWMNLVERFFRDVTEDVIREGSFSRVQELVDDIELHLEQRDDNPGPYRWNAKGEEILAKIRRAREKLESLK
jgi:transposase